MSGMEDVFGHMAARPDHPDFWKLSEIILRHDAATDQSLPTDVKDRQFEALMDETNCDRESVTYVALQRAIRVVGVTTREGILSNFDIIMKMMSLYLDAFLTGCAYTRDQFGTTKGQGKSEPNKP